MHIMHNSSFLGTFYTVCVICYPKKRVCVLGFDRLGKKMFLALGQMVVVGASCMFGDSCMASCFGTEQANTTHVLG